MLLNLSRLTHSNQLRGLLAALIVIYAVIYGWLLISTDFLPYVMDNNETFSSLWHARSMHDFGFSKTFGLADEVFSPHPAAHPYVHSHQGNFPRIFAWMIYELGASSAESQIIVTTSTVGLGTIILMFLFFTKIANPVFGFLVCFIFMTDYLLFAQWQVVTYRVWYGFLLFLGLWSVEQAINAQSKGWLWLLGVTAASLLYFELVFAAYAGLFSFFWLLARTYKKPLTLLKIALWMVGGAAIGLSVFVAQAIGYLGLSNFLKDIHFTFSARNNIDNMTNLNADIVPFYESLHVIFWHNLQDRSSFSGWMPFIRSFTSFDWQIHTPLFSACLGVILLGGIVSMLPQRLNNQDSLLREKSIVSIDIFHSALMYILLSLNCFLLISNLNFVNGVLNPDSPVFKITLGSVFGTLLFVWASSAIAGRTPVIHIVILISTVVCVLINFPYFFDQEYAPLWQALQGNLNGVAGQTMFVSSIIVALGWMSASASLKHPSYPAHNLRGVFGYLCAGLLSYSIVFYLSPGYVYSGYLARLAPFTVFISDVLVALAIYITIAATYRFSLVVEADVYKYYRLSLCALSGGLASVFLGFWIALQLTYVRLMPPDHYSFLKALSLPPFVGASFVVNNYAAPVAAYTGNWAFFDPSISTGIQSYENDGAKLSSDQKYLWFADRDTNPDYRRPRYYVCMIAQNPSTVLAKIKKMYGMGTDHLGCSRLQLVRLADGKDSPTLGLRLVAIDSEGLKHRGFDSWAIIEFDWSSRLNELFDAQSLSLEGKR